MPKIEVNLRKDHPQLQQAQTSVKDFMSNIKSYCKKLIPSLQKSKEWEEWIDENKPDDLGTHDLTNDPSFLYLLSEKYNELGDEYKNNANMLFIASEFYMGSKIELIGFNQTDNKKEIGYKISTKQHQTFAVVDEDCSENKLFPNVDLVTEETAKSINTYKM